LRGVPRDPTAWQVYSAADVLFALLVVALLAVTMLGLRRLRIIVAACAAAALVFTLHALSSPPTNGATIFNPAYSVPHYASPGASAAGGETLAILALLMALAGLALSFTSD
jgi:hypothetical protein